jgi:RNA polymerase sigma-70 factor (ECF subfamily)
MEYDFKKLCLPCYDELLAFAYKRTRNLAEAEDIVQDSMVRALKAWKRWEPQTGDAELQARAWMYRIVNGTFINQYHRVKNFNRIVDENSRQVSEACYQDDHFSHPYLDSQELGDEVREALERITPEWADVVRLVYLEGHTAPEVAEILDLPPGTVRSRMARGRLALARILAPVARQRFGFHVQSLDGSADEASADEAFELPETETDGIDGVMAEDDDSLLGIA